MYYFLPLYISFQLSTCALVYVNLTSVFPEHPNLKKNAYSTYLEYLLLVKFLSGQPLLSYKGRDLLPHTSKQKDSCLPEKYIVRLVIFSLCGNSTITGGARDVSQLSFREGFSHLDRKLSSHPWYQMSFVILFPIRLLCPSLKTSVSQEQTPHFRKCLKAVNLFDKESQSLISF